MPDQPSRKFWRQRLRLSVRGLMILVLVVGGGLGWIIQSAHVQRDAVTAITAAGGTVFYNWQIRCDGSFLSNPKPWAPKWLVDRVGIDYFGHVARIASCDMDLMET
jgi:hypothetical protein